MLLLVERALLVLRGLALIRLEADLKHAIAESVTIERLNSDYSFLVVGHCDEAEALAFVGLEITNNLDRLDCTEWTEQLP